MEELLKTVVVGQNAPNDTIELTALDVLMGMVNAGGLFFFDGEPDLARMRASMSAALDRFPTFGATLRRHGGLFTIKRNNVGVSFSAYRSCECPDESSTRAILHGSDLWDADIAPEDFFDGHAPLLSVRIVIYNNRSYSLGIRNVHCLADGASILKFLLCWSRLYRGLVVNEEEPVARAMLRHYARGDGLAPSAKLSVIARPPYSVSKRLAMGDLRFESQRVELAREAFADLVRSCKAHAEVSSSDVIHALVWKALALSSDCAATTALAIYAVCDLRRSRALHFPAHFEGNALLERKAEAPAQWLRDKSLALLAQQFHAQVKQVSAEEIGADIAFLEREYAQGRILPLGGFTSFIRGALDGCLQNRGMFVNDMHGFASHEVHFESPARRHEVMIALNFPCVTILSTPTQDLLLRVVAHKERLANFTEAIRGICNDVSAPVAIGHVQ